MKRTALRRYAWIKPRSDKVVKAQPSFQAVYDEVDRRSEGRCEWLNYQGMVAPVVRCQSRATDHHHTVKPRRSSHEAALIIHLCRGHHDRCTWPYTRGRGTVTSMGLGRFLCKVVYAKDKFAARGQG